MFQILYSQISVMELIEIRGFKQVVSAFSFSIIPPIIYRIHNIHVCRFMYLHDDFPNNNNSHLFYTPIGFTVNVIWNSALLQPTSNYNTGIHSNN